MACLAVCNTLSDSVSIVDLEDCRVKHISLSKEGELLGPHGLVKYKDYIITANSFNNTISFSSIAELLERDIITVGSHPNDIKVIDSKGYIACGESNSILVMNMENKEVECLINTEDNPHSLIVDYKKKLLYVVNMYGKSISIMDCKSNEVTKNIMMEEYPTCGVLSKNGENLFVSGSNDFNKGYVSVISTEDPLSVVKIEVGDSPGDIYEEGGKLFVSNSISGTISIIDLTSLKVESTIYIGGMPKGIYKKDEYIYCCDMLYGVMKRIHLKDNKIKTILLGKEPNNMIFYN